MTPSLIRPTACQEWNLRFFLASNALTPLLGVVGGISLLVATLSTVAVFLRLRTASLGEIQLRLAALEEMLLSKQIEELD